MKKCCECDKMFSTLYNLRKHAKKFHSDKVDDVAPRKKFTYRCDLCERNFNVLRNFTYHNKKMHSTENTLEKSTAKLNCVLCQFNATKAELLVHFETEHNIQIKTDTFEFNSIEKFIDWKNKLEISTQAKFVKQRGNFSTNDNRTIIKYVCHRSGNYISKGKNLRHLKTQGSNKINGFCPACIKVEIKNNKYQVSLINQHVGHQHDLGHLPLTFEEREKLASQIALKIPFNEILDQVKDSKQGSQLERIHLLRKRDLYNIGKSFNLQSIVIRHQHNAAISVEADDSLFDDINLRSEEEDGILTEGNSRMSEKEPEESKLTKEKNKIITNLLPNITKVVENISCIEQVDEFKKLCASIAPSLSVIVNSHKELKEPACSDNLFASHNSKIIPERGKITFHQKEKKK